jgi:hypothetical protein
MPGSWYWFTEQDAAVIRDLIRRVKGDRENVPVRTPSPQSEEEDFTTPEVYIAWPPAAGIPAMASGVGTAPDVPGSATCDIYQIQVDGSTPELIQVEGLTRVVYNLSNAAIPQDWIVAGRDKFGRWLALGGAGAGLPEGDSDNDILRWEHTGTGSGGEGEWVIHPAPTGTGGPWALTISSGGVMEWLEFEEFECPGTGS